MHKEETKNSSQRFDRKKKYIRIVITYADTPQPF